MIDPLESLSADVVWCRCYGLRGPIIWSAGASWISRDGNEWWLDDDQPATEDEIREVIKRAGGAAELHCDEVPPRPPVIHP